MAPFGKKQGADPKAGSSGQAAQAPSGFSRLAASIPILRNLAQKVETLSTLQGGAATDKPRLDILYLGSESKVQIPRLALSYLAQQEISYLCPAMSAAQIKHRQEVFRHLGKWKPKFQRRCSGCDARYRDDVPHLPQPPPQMDPLTGAMSPQQEPQEHCPKCGQTGTLVPADEADYSFAQQKFDRMNEAGQNLWDVLYQTHDDKLISDDFYLVAIPRYWWDPERKMLLREVKEIIRGNPNVMRIVSDGRGNRGGAFLSCPLHRTLVFNMGMTAQGKTQVGYFETDAQASPYSTNRRTPTCCPKCKEEGRDVKLRDVWYVATEAGGQKPVAYYFEDEVLHASFFRPSLLYGISPVATLFREADSLIRMEEYIQEYFVRRRIPRGVVMIRRTANTPIGPPMPVPQAENDLAKDNMNRQMRDDHHDIPLVSMAGADDIKFIPFADTIREMEYIPVREEFKRNIGGFYGLTPLFMAQTEGGGGLANDSQQLAVTSRAIEASQSLYNTKVFPWLLKLLDVHEWTYELEKPERQDLLNEVQLELAATELALQKRELGFTVKYWDNSKKRYVFSEKPESNPEALNQMTLGRPGKYDTLHHDNGLGDESEGMSHKPKAPATQKHEGTPEHVKRGDSR